MSEEEVFEPTAETEAESGAEEEAYEEEIDLNAALLEVMVKRTEVLEQLLRGESSLEVVTEKLEAITVPEAKRRRRRK